MDYKLIKENFERATAELLKEQQDDQQLKTGDHNDARKTIYQDMYNMVTSKDFGNDLDFIYDDLNDPVNVYAVRGDAPAHKVTHAEIEAVAVLEGIVNNFQSQGIGDDRLSPLENSTHPALKILNGLMEDVHEEMTRMRHDIRAFAVALEQSRVRMYNKQPQDQDSDEPEEADYDTETGEFIGEKKKKPTPEPKKEEVYGMGTSMDQSVAKKKGLAAARANGFVAGMPFREQMSMNPSTGEYTYKMIKI